MVVLCGEKKNKSKYCKNLWSETDNLAIYFRLSKNRTINYHFLSYQMVTREFAYMPFRTKTIAHNTIHKQIVLSTQRENSSICSCAIVCCTLLYVGVRCDCKLYSRNDGTHSLDGTINTIFSLRYTQ